MITRHRMLVLLAAMASDPPTSFAQSRPRSTSPARGIVASLARPGGNVPPPGDGIFTRYDRPMLRRLLARHLVAPNDPRALAQAVVWLAARPAEQRRLVTEAAGYMRERTWSRAARLVAGELAGAGGRT